jgi:hypothetical protein
MIKPILIQDSAEEARSAQEKFHQEMEERFIHEEKIILLLQQGPAVKSNTLGISSPINALLYTYHELDMTARRL